jgi:hypothetical protein
MTINTNFGLLIARLARRELYNHVKLKEKLMMKEMSGTKLASAVILALGLLRPQVALALSFDNQDFVQYGDGQSYSLPITAFINNCTNPGCPFVIQSSPGQIKDLVVVATGAGGVPVNTNFAGMDNAYSTPNSGGVPFFRTGTTVSDPGGAAQFSGDKATTWDTTLGALKTFLAGDSLVFFFNNNQINSGAATNQNLAAWAQITISDASGTPIFTYDFTNNGGNYALFTEGGGGVFNGDVATYTSLGLPPTGAATGSPTDYVLSGGAICLTATNVPVSCSNPLAVTNPFNHNLGADQAAYAILFPELNAQLASLFASLSAADLAAYSMNIDVRLGCDPALFNTSAACLAKDLNNGFEQIFFGPLESLVIPPVPVPEPSSFLLFGSGLIALASLARKHWGKK